MLSFRFKLGNKLVNQSRRVYSLLDFGADIGGLYGTVEPVCAVLVALISGAIYSTDLVSNTYPIHNQGSSPPPTLIQPNHVSNKMSPAVNPSNRAEDFRGT